MSEHLSLDSIRFDALDYDVWKSTLSLTVDDLSSGPWEGSFMEPGRTVVLANVSESADDHGYFYCRVMGVGGGSETKRPVAACGVGLMLDTMLAAHGVTAGQLNWKRADRSVAPTPTKARPTDEIVYFLRAGEFIKIGKATGSPDSRIAQLKTGCPFPIEVVGTMAGGFDEERALHRRFAAIRAHGEWFHATPELIDFIAEVAR